MENAEDNSGDFQGTLTNVLQSSLEAKPSDSDDADAVYRATNKRQDNFEENHGDFEEYGDRCCSAFNSRKQNIEDLKTITASSRSDSGDSLLAMQGSDTSFLENYLMGRVENNIGRDLIRKSERNSRFANVFGKSDFSDYFTCSYQDAETSVLNIQQLMEDQVDKYKLQVMEESKQNFRVSTEYKEVESDGDEPPPEAQNFDSLNELLLYHREESSGLKSNQRLSPNENESDSEIESYESDRTSLNEFLPDLIQSEFLSNELNCKNTIDETRNERHSVPLKPFASSIISTAETQNMSEKEYIDLSLILKMKGNSDENESEESNLDQVQLEFVDAERNDSILQPLQHNNDSTQVIDLILPDIQSLVFSETPCSCEHYNIESGINERNVEGDQFPTNENIGKDENESFESKSSWKRPGISNACESANHFLSLAANLHSSFENDQIEIGISERDTVDNHFSVGGVNETGKEPIWTPIGLNSIDFSESTFPIYQLESGNGEANSSQEQQYHIQKDFKLSYIPSKLNISGVTDSYENNEIDILQNEFSISSTKYDNGKEDPEVYKSTLNEIVENEVSSTSADEEIGIDQPEFYKSIPNEMVKNDFSITSEDDEVGKDEQEFYESTQSEIVEKEVSITSAYKDIGIDKPEIYTSIPNEMIENDFSITSEDEGIGKDEQEFYKSIQNEIVENDFSITSVEDEIKNDEPEFYKSIPNEMVKNDFSITSAEDEIEKEEQFHKSIPNEIVENEFSITAVDEEIEKGEQEFYKSTQNENEFPITSVNEKNGKDETEFLKSTLSLNEIIENEFSITSADEEIGNDEQEIYKSIRTSLKEIVENEFSITSPEEKIGKDEQEFYNSTLIRLNEMGDSHLPSVSDEIVNDAFEFLQCHNDTHEVFTLPDIQSDISPEVQSDICPEIQSDIFTEIQSDISPEVQSDISPEVQSDISPEVQSDICPEIQSNISPKIQSDISPEIQSNISLEIQSNISPKIQSDSSPEIQSEISPEIQSEISPEIQSEISPEIQSDISPEIQSEISPEIQSEISPEIQSDISPEIQSEISPEIQSDISSEILSDNSPEIQSGIIPEIQSDNSPEIQSDFYPEIQSDNSPEIQSDFYPEIQSDFYPEIQSGIIPEIQSDISPEIQSDIAPEIQSYISPEIQCDYENNQDVELLINEKCWNDEMKEVTPCSMSQYSNEDHLGESNLQSVSFACECVDIDINDSLLQRINVTEVDFSFPDIEICTSEIESNCQSDENICIAERNVDHLSVEKDIETNEAELGEVTLSLIIPEPDNSSKNNFCELNLSNVELNESVQQNNNDTHVVDFPLPNVQRNFVSGSTGDSEINETEISVVEKDTDNDNMQSQIRKRKHRHENSSSTTTVNSMVEITKKVKMIDTDYYENRSAMGDSDVKQNWELYVRNDCSESETNNSREEQEIDIECEIDVECETEKFEVHIEPETASAEVQPDNFVMGLCTRLKTFFTNIPNLFRKRRYRRVDASSEKQ